MSNKTIIAGVMLTVGVLSVGCSGGGGGTHNASWQAGYNRAWGDQQLAGVVGSGFCERYWRDGPYNFDDWMAGCQAALKKIPSR